MRPELKKVIRFILVVAAIVASFEAGRATSPRESCVSVPVPAAVTPTEAGARPPWAIQGFRDDAECRISGDIPNATN